MTMKADDSKSIFSASTFAWPNTLGVGWYRPGSAATDLLDAQMMRLQHFTQTMQEAYTDTYSRQMDVFNEAAGRMQKTVQEMMHCQGPADLLTTETQMAAVMLDAASQRTQNWMELGRKLQECCADLAQSSIEDLRKRSEDLADEASEADDETTHRSHHAHHTHHAHKTIKAVKNTAKHAA
ncbi:phasin family protein [Dongia soli]|uniref:Phasin protein n=1 Tax=Dongia soli TaxID=600628 RepID=A0ABU5EEZ2_9PROT|nr:phasin family protein [Dongia soli]MDY0884783.1 hypothetical protein [Dongia soli]